MTRGEAPAEAAPDQGMLTMVTVSGLLEGVWRDPMVVMGTRSIDEEAVVDARTTVSSKRTVITPPIGKFCNQIRIRYTT